MNDSCYALIWYSIPIILLAKQLVFCLNLCLSKSSFPFYLFLFQQKHRRSIFVNRNILKASKTFLSPFFIVECIMLLLSSILAHFLQCQYLCYIRFTACSTFAFSIFSQRKFSFQMNSCFCMTYRNYLVNQFVDIIFHIKVTLQDYNNL